MAGTENKVIDALSRVVFILSSMAVQVVGFDLLKSDYPSCKDFSIFMLVWWLDNMLNTWISHCMMVTFLRVLVFACLILLYVKKLFESYILVK